MKRRSCIDQEVQWVMKCELDLVWMRGKEKNRQKIDLLVNRYKPKEHLEKIRDVEYSDEGLEGINVDEDCNPIVFDNI